MHERMFRSAIAFLIGFTGLSCLQVAFFPRLPAASEPEVDLGTMPGAPPLFMGELPGQQSRDWALSPTRRYELTSQHEQQPSSDLDLLMTGATVRRAEHLQVALITQGNPHLEMDRRRVYRTAAGDEYAIGMIGGREALQSCQVPSGRDVTQETLAELMPVKPCSVRTSPSSCGGLPVCRPIEMSSAC